MRTDALHHGPPITDAAPAEVAVAVAWHHEACGMRGLASRQCRYWPVHLHSARRFCEALRDAGFSVTALAEKGTPE